MKCDAVFRFVEPLFRKRFKGERRYDDFNGVIEIQYVN